MRSVKGPLRGKMLSLAQHDLLSLLLLEERSKVTALELEVSRAERHKLLRSHRDALEAMQRSFDAQIATHEERERGLLHQLKEREEELEGYKCELSVPYAVDFQSDPTVQYDDVTGQIFRIVEGRPVPVPVDKKKR